MRLVIFIANAGARVHLMFEPLSLRYVAAFGCPCLVSWLLTAMLLRLAPHWGLIDQPSARKVHTRPVPRGGGLAIYAGVLGGVWTMSRGLSTPLPGILAAAFIIVAIGLTDDMRPLPWYLRLSVQTIVTAGTVNALHADQGWLYQAVAVLWIVGLINAFNMLDNMDAQSAGVAWIAAGMLALLAAHGSGGPGSQLYFDQEQTLPCLMLMGALSGFLWFNRPPARIFMGDAGSTFLGFFLGLRSLDTFRGESPTPRALAATICIFAVPCYDLVSVVALRIWQGRSPFHADKQHLSHRLVALGLTPPIAVAVIYLLALASGVGGLLIYRSPEESMSLMGFQLASWWLVIAAVEYFRHYRKPTSPA
jgi:UDP-GlcNAc:undecaprenyl-phosphate GlcNAc-1-phosphate transferase